MPAGTRVYAIGDIHGRLDLLDAMLAMIEADSAARGAVETTRLVLLGDFVDRGPDSAGVVERCRWLVENSPDVSYIIGNHEEILLGVIKGSKQMAGLFDRVGGRATLLSYGVDDAVYEQATLDDVIQMAREHVSEDHRDFLRSGADQLLIGDYLFVHAGIRPGVPLDEQLASDLRWIREPFLSSTRDHGVTVVHGHTITEEVDLQPNRIGIDTGAYATGKLTAIGLEGEERWLLQT